MTSDILRRAGVPAEPALCARLEQYAALLTEQNRVMNLTAITEPAQIAARHFADSLLLARALPLAGKRLIDIGTGAGFPGIPLALAVPSLSVTLLDATRKKVEFLRRAAGALGLENAEPVHARAEEAARGMMRAQFDIAVSRAVADLPALCELCLPFVRTGGVFAAMKGARFREEAHMAARAVELLGGRFRAPFCYTLPDTEGEFAILLIEKVRETPEKYPRAFAKIRKSPL